MANPVLKPPTFDDIEALEHRDGLRYELWRNEPVAMTGGTSAHNLITLALHRRLDDQPKLPCVAYAARYGLEAATGRLQRQSLP